MSLNEARADCRKLEKLCEVDSNYSNVLLISIIQNLIDAISDIQRQLDDERRYKQMSSY